MGITFVFGGSTVYQNWTSHGLRCKFRSAVHLFYEGLHDGL